MLTRSDERSRPVARSAAAPALFLVAALAPACERRDAPPPAGPPPAIVRTPSGVDMVLIPAGSFVMGDPAGDKDERPPHEMEVSAFLIDRTEVTQESFEKLVGSNPSKRERKGDAVDQVRWTDAIDYCNQRSAAEGLEPCYDLKTFACRFEASGYRLPTEAEWEYACRAGTRTRYFFGDDPARLDAHAWFDRNAAKDSRPVGARKPNAWGLHDMAGSLLEWCNDFYSPDYYPASPRKDPTGPPSGKDRVLRGGCWSLGAEKCRSAIRFHDQPACPDSCFGWDSYGFRCVRRAPAGAAAAK